VIEVNVVAMVVDKGEMALIREDRVAKAVGLGEAMEMEEGTVEGRVSSVLAIARPTLRPLPSIPKKMKTLQKTLMATILPLQSITLQPSRSALGLIPKSSRNPMTMYLLPSVYRPHLPLNSQYEDERERSERHGIHERRSASLQQRRPENEEDRRNVPLFR
jgi:hypothetical protein